MPRIFSDSDPAEFTETLARYRAALVICRWLIES